MTEHKPIAPEAAAARKGRASRTLAAIASRLRAAKKTAGEAIEAGSWAVENWAAPQAEMITGVLFVLAALAGSGATGWIVWNMDWLSPQQVASRGEWAAKEWVLAPESDFALPLHPFAEKGEKDAAGVQDAERGALPPAIVETRESWEAAQPARRAGARAEPIPIGLAGELALAEGGDGSPRAALEEAKKIARAKGWAARLPNIRQSLALTLDDAGRLGDAESGTLPLGSAWARYSEDAQVARDAAAAKADPSAANRFLGSLQEHMLAFVAGVIAATLGGLAAGAIAAPFLLGASELLAWANGGVRLARWGAWRPLARWGAKSGSMAAFGVAIACAGALGGRFAADAVAASAGGRLAFETARASMPGAPALAGEVEKPEGACPGVQWLWAMQADSMVARASAWLGREPSPWRAAEAEQERFAGQCRGLASMFGAGIALGCALAAVERRRLIKKGLKAPAARARAQETVGAPEWQKEQIRLARARAEAKELAAAARLRESAGAGMLAADSAAPDGVAEEAGRRAKPRRL
jgi:hypothetical protein